jgi:hypothetical protein
VRDAACVNEMVDVARRLRSAGYCPESNTEAGDQAQSTGPEELVRPTTHADGVYRAEDVTDQ